MPARDRRLSPTDDERDSGDRKLSHACAASDAPHRARPPGAAMADASNGGDEFNRHDGGGVSILGVDGRRYTVDESTASYFYEIEALLQTDPETPEQVEERTILAGNALEEAVGYEMALSMDARCSRIVEKLLTAAGDDDLVRFLAGITKEATDFYVLCKSLFGSRVAEHALGCVAAKVGKTPSEELLGKLEPPLRAVADGIVAEAVNCAYDPRVSPVARKFLSVLSGRECAPVAKAGGLAGKLKGGTSKAGAFADSGIGQPDRHRFDDELKAFADAMLAALEPELWNLTEDACGSAFLQAMLNAHQGDAAALNWIVPGFLGCAPAVGTPEGELLADADEKDVRQLMDSRAGSHLFEAILRAAPPKLLNEIFRRFFRGKLRALSSHPSANFVLQAFLGATGDADHVATALMELGQDFGSLMRERRAGVVAAILAACARTRSGERDAAKSLARGLTAKMPARKEGRSQLAPALLWMNQHSGAGGGRCDVLGAAMLQTILKFPPDAIPQFIESVASMTSGEAVSAACDPGGSRALEAFLGSHAHRPRDKKDVVQSLSGDWAKLATSACGSHVLEAAYGAADQRTRENIVSAMSRAESQIQGTRHGPHLLRRLGVSQFRADPEQWNKRAKQAEDVKADFAREFGMEEEEEEDNRGPKKRKTEDFAQEEHANEGEAKEDEEDEEAPKEKKAKKEKKEKKEKKAKKEKKEKKEKR